MMINAQGHIGTMATWDLTWPCCTEWLWVFNQLSFSACLSFCLSVCHPKHSTKVIMHKPLYCASLNIQAFICFRSFPFLLRADHNPPPQYKASNVTKSPPSKNETSKISFRKLTHCKKSNNHGAHTYPSTCLFLAISHGVNNCNCFLMNYSCC